jgi:SAM-dependent methyltransferase
MLRRLSIRGSKLLSRKGLYRFLDFAFARIKASSSVLNVGAGGEIEALLRERAASQGFQVVSIDIDGKRGPDIVTDVLSTPFAPESFDVVVMAEVLEHLQDPLKAVAHLHSLLRPGGQIIVSVPFMFPIHDRPHDYFRFTRYGLEMMFRGFRDLTVEERNNWLEAIGVIASRIALERHWSCKVAAPFIVLGLLLLAPLAALLGRMVRTDFATTGYVLRALK